jgi:hypothetical protein
VTWKACVRGSVAVFFAWAIVLAPGGARGTEEERLVFVLGEGTGAEEIASRVASRLTAPYVARDPAPLRRSLAAARAPSLAAASTEGAKDAKLVSRTWLAVRRAHADAAVLVHVRRSKQGVSAHLWLIEAKSDGASTLDQEIALSARASTADVTDAIWTRLAPNLPSPGAPAPEATAPSQDLPATPTGVEMTQPTTAVAPSPERASPPASEPERAAVPRAREDALFVVRALVEVGTRHFSYVDRVTTSLRSYDLLAAPLVGVHGELCPFSRTSVPVLKDFSVSGDYRLAFGLSSTDSAGDSVSTSWSSFDIGARERVHLNESLALGLHGGYGQNAYTFGAVSEDTALPGVQYRFIAGGLDARLTLPRLSLYLSGSYLGVLSAAPTGTYFPRATVGGVEGTIGAAYSLAYGFELSLEIAYTRFFYSMNPEPGDAYVAGGALDQMGRGALGLGYVF